MEDIEDFCEDNLKWLRQYGDFDNGIPVHDTIARVVNMISAKQLQRCFSKWKKDFHKVTKGDVVAIDGKTISRTYNKDKRCGAIHMASAFSATNHTVLGQLKTADKSNEIKAIHEILELLSIKGCLITIDAMGCQKDIAEKINTKEADYLLDVKGNQKRLEKAINEMFYTSMINNFESDKFVIQEQDDAVTETRLCLVEHDVAFLMMLNSTGRNSPHCE